MTIKDPIASATLARLYLGQGHVQRATKILTEVLERTPWDGAALHLQERLGSAPARIQLSVGREGISLRWQGARPSLHAIIACYRRGRGLTRSAPGHFVTSAACRAAFGESLWERPWSEGTVVGCLGAVGPHGFSPVAISPAVLWD